MTDPRRDRAIRHTHKGAESENIQVGQAEVCFHEVERCWVLPGGWRTRNRRKAINAARSMNEIMERRS